MMTASQPNSWTGFFHRALRVTSLLVDFRNVGRGDDAYDPLLVSRLAGRISA